MDREQQYFDVPEWSCADWVMDDHSLKTCDVCKRNLEKHREEFEAVLKDG
jgi:hypothetical protein